MSAANLNQIRWRGLELRGRGELVTQRDYWQNQARWISRATMQVVLAADEAIKRKTVIQLGSQ